ncbi:hypothetical protein SDRG_17397, partial [Saprolegnia diclina VS20]
MKTFVPAALCALVAVQCIDSASAATTTQNLRATGWGNGGSGGSVLGINLGGAISSLVQNCLNGYGLFDGGNGGANANINVNPN